MLGAGSGVSTFAVQTRRAGSCARSRHLVVRREDRAGERAGGRVGGQLRDHARLARGRAGARRRRRRDRRDRRAADLRFTADEAADYLAGPMGLALTAARRRHAGRAHRGLGGRSAAGRAVAAGPRRPQRGRRQVRRRRPLHRRLPRRGGAGRGSPPTSATSCCRRPSSTRLTGPLCDAVTGQAGGAARLVALERANLFLVPLDDQRQLVPLPPPVRRRPARAPARAAARPGRRAAPAGLRMVRRSTATGRGHRPRPGRRGLRPRRGPDGARHAGDGRERREAELARWVRELPDDVVQARPVLGRRVRRRARAGVGLRHRRQATVRHRGVRCARTAGAWPERPPPGLVVVDEDGYRSLPAPSRCTGPRWRSHDGDLGRAPSPTRGRRCRWPRRATT